MCTSLTLNAKDGAVIHGRTNEFTALYKSELVFRPRNTKQPSWFIPKNEYTWENKYSYIGLNALGIIANENLTLDGLNEKGLSGSVLYFHYHDYKTLKPEEIKKDDVHMLHFLGYIIGNYATVQEIRDDHEKIEKKFYWLEGMTQAGLGSHFTLVDQSGDALVIEPENKKINFKESPLRVLTNSSPLEYHYENLRKYSHLVSNEVHQTMMFKDLPHHELLTQGNGLFGIPGDFTADSRFIRAAIFSQLADDADTAEESVTTLFRLLHTADVVPGLITDQLTKEGLEARYKIFPATIQTNQRENSITDHTDNMLVKDLKNLKFYYKTYGNISPRFIDLNLIKDSDKEIRITIDHDGTTKYQEVKLS